MIQQVGGVIGGDMTLTTGRLGTGGVVGTQTETCLHPMRVGVAMEEEISMIDGGELSLEVVYSFIIEL